MPKFAVIGNDLTAQSLALAFQQAGFARIDRYDGPTSSTSPPAFTLPPNITRVLGALGLMDELLARATLPDRQQVRMARSTYLVSELPLGKFARDRYGAPMVNIDANILQSLMSSTSALKAGALQSDQPLEQLEHQYDAVLDCSQAAVNSEPTHSFWHARLARVESTANANITWLSPTHSAWQFSTGDYSHFFFTGKMGYPIEENEWHLSLHEAISQAKVLYDFNPSSHPVRENWYAGNVAWLGNACYQINPYHREAIQLGVEDAWVMSRMLENYEEDIHDAFRQYQYYRLPRANKIIQAMSKTAIAFDQPSAYKNTLRNVGIALGTRFLPELAMQKIDWFYNYDCIRGFR